MRFFEILSEANVLNMTQINKQLEDLTIHIEGGPVPDPYKKQWIKAAVNDILNNAEYHKPVTQLPVDAPLWAKSAFERKDLVNADIDHKITKLKDILHWLVDIINTAKRPAVTEVEKEDKALAGKQLNSISRMSLNDMGTKQEEWFSRHKSRTAQVGSVEGMSKIADVGNGYSWWILVTQAAFTREGQALANCIGRNYTEQSCKSTGQAIMVLKDADNNSSVALRYRPKEKILLEVKGLNNKPPISSLMPYTNKIIQQLDLVPDYAGNTDLNNAGYIYDENDKRIYHVSEKYPFENGPQLSQNLMLVKWTAPIQFVRSSFRGNNAVGQYHNINARWDLVHSKNREHTIYSFSIGNENNLNAIGNLPSTNRIITKNGSIQMAKRFIEVANALNVIIPDQFTGVLNNPGLNRYGIKVENNNLSIDRALAMEVSVHSNPESIQSIENPPENLQLVAVNKKPDTLILINNSSDIVQMTAFQKAHDAGSLMAKFLQTRNNAAPSEAVQMSAVENWPYVVDNLLFAHPPASNKVLARAVEKNGETLWHICKQFRKLERNDVPREIVRVALKENSDAIGAMLHYKFDINPIDIINAINSYNESFDVDIIKEYLERYNYDNPAVMQAITNRLNKLGIK